MKKKRFDSGAILMYLIIAIIFYPALHDIAMTIGIDKGKIKTTNTACISCYVDYHTPKGMPGIPYMTLTYADGTKVKALKKVISEETMKAYQNNPGALKATYVPYWRGFDDSYTIVALRDINTGQDLIRLDDARAVYWSVGSSLVITGIVFEAIHTLILYGDKILDWRGKRQQEKNRQKNRARREEQKQRRVQLMAEQSDSAAGDAKVHAKPDPNASKKKRKRR